MDFKKLASDAGTLFNRAKQVILCPVYDGLGVNAYARHMLNTSRCLKHGSSSSFA